MCQGFKSQLHHQLGVLGQVSPFPSRGLFPRDLQNGDDSSLPHAHPSAGPPLRAQLWALSCHSLEMDTFEKSPRGSPGPLSSQQSRWWEVAVGGGWETAPPPPRAAC